MTETLSLTNHFLIAMPSLPDPNFFHSVTYICQHNEEGAMGIVITNPMDLTLGDVFEQMDIRIRDVEIASRPVYLGGPVQPERGFVIHELPGDWDAMMEISDAVGLTTSRDVLDAISRGEGPKRSLIALGYAGWGPGQLEKEIADNAWLSGPATPEILFDLPTNKRWAAAAALVGVDLNRLSGEVGHA